MASGGSGDGVEQGSGFFSKERPGKGAGRVQDAVEASWLGVGRTAGIRSSSEGFGAVETAHGGLVHPGEGTRDGRAVGYGARVKTLTLVLLAGVGENLRATYVCKSRVVVGGQQTESDF